jgi:hypothetical protein
MHRRGLLPDGVYRCGADGGREFFGAGSPTGDAVHALPQSRVARPMKMFTRRAALVEDKGQTCLAEPDADGRQARTLRPLQAAAVTATTTRATGAPATATRIGSSRPKG